MHVLGRGNRDCGRRIGCGRTAHRRLGSRGLAGRIILNLVTGPGFYDIALRDFGLLVGAIALARLAQGVHSGGIGRP